MRFAFSSLRESSSWLPTVIQLLVRKHSRDARRQRAIALKSLAVGFVVRENVFRYFLFFSPPPFAFDECIFDRVLVAKNGQWSRNSSRRYPRARGLITHLSWQTAKREAKIIEKEYRIAVTKIYCCLNLCQQIGKAFSFGKLYSRFDIHTDK